MKRLTYYSARAVKRCLRLLGYDIVRITEHPFLASRVTCAGMRRALVQAKKNSSSRRILMLVDREVDRGGNSFCKSFQVPIKVAEQSPAVDLQDVDIADTIFVCGFHSDEQASRYLEHIVAQGGKFVCSQDWSPPKWWHMRDQAYAVLKADRDESLQCGYSHFALEQLAQILQAIDMSESVVGAYVEIGVYNGTSARAAYHYMARKGLSRRCYFMDTFEGFNYPAARFSPDCLWLNTHEASRQIIESRLKAVPNVPVGLTYILHKIDIVEDSLPQEVGDIALCNIDVDMYEAVRSALLKVAPRVAAGGIIIVQDPGQTPALGGARLALDQFLREPLAKDFSAVCLESGQTFLIRK